MKGGGKISKEQLRRLKVERVEEKVVKPVKKINKKIYKKKTNY